MENSFSFNKSELSRYFVNGGKEGRHVLRKGEPFELTPYKIGGKDENFVTCQGLDANRLVAIGAAEREVGDDTVSYSIPKKIAVQVTLVRKDKITPKDGEPYEKSVWDYKVVE